MTGLEHQMAAALSSSGQALPESASARLAAYLQLLVKWNKTYNLTAIQAPEQMLTLHILDSLAVLPHVSSGRLLDVGSGAGLPGIPLAVARPDLQVTLLDTNGKKCAFMRQAVIELGLGNVEVVQARVEAYQPEACYQQIISRAFSDLAEFASLTGHLLCTSGQWLAMKGAYPDEEVARLKGVRVTQHMQLNVPGLGAERHLIIMEPVE